MPISGKAAADIISEALKAVAREPSKLSDAVLEKLVRGYGAAFNNCAAPKSPLPTAFPPNARRCVLIESSRGRSQG